VKVFLERGGRGGGLKRELFVIHHLLCQFSHPENGGDMFHRNVCVYRAYYTVQTTRDDRNVKTDTQLGAA